MNASAPIASANISTNKSNKVKRCANATRKAFEHLLFYFKIKL